MAGGATDRTTERKFHGDVSTIARNSTRIADALEEIAAQVRDYLTGLRASNLAALEREAGRAGEITRPVPMPVAPPPGTTRLHVEGDVCNVNRCTEPPVAGTDFCARHQDRA